jgi:GMP synthase-like glutamine amidotransferase
LNLADSRKYGPDEVSMKPRILLIDNSIDPARYRPLSHWQPLLIHPFDCLRAPVEVLPEDLSSYSHVLLTGSTASVIDDRDWMQSEARLIRKAVQDGRVVLGSCFGHQLIARALFGSASVRARQTPDIGWAKFDIVEDDLLLGSAGRSLSAYVFHFDEVTGVPSAEALVTARSPECDIMAFRLRAKPVWGIQPHFEIGIVEGLQLLDQSAASGVPARLEFLDGTRPVPRDSGWIAPLMQAFQQARPVGTA